MLLVSTLPGLVVLLATLLRMHFALFCSCYRYVEHIPPLCCPVDITTVSQILFMAWKTWLSRLDCTSVEAATASFSCRSDFISFAAESQDGVWDSAHVCLSLLSARISLRSENT